jgi:hypothetical protein
MLSEHCQLLTISVLYILYILCILTTNVLIKLTTMNKIVINRLVHTPSLYSIPEDSNWVPKHVVVFLYVLCILYHEVYSVVNILIVEKCTV